MSGWTAGPPWAGWGLGAPAGGRRLLLVRVHRYYRGSYYVGSQGAGWGIIVRITQVVAVG